MEAVCSAYIRFADHEASGVSPRYEGYARAVAADDEALALIATLPTRKQQANLVFASVRAHCGLADDGKHFCALLKEHRRLVLATVLRRSTQTNEPARCATLLPLLSALPQPLALLEVGASAGLCLFPDRYNYHYSNGHELRVDSSHHRPTFECDIAGPVPIPSKLPSVVWRSGIDLNPLDPSDADTARWLELLIWPEQAARAENLRRAIGSTDHSDVQIHKGDLLTDLAHIASAAPKDATLVIFHSAVLAYVSDAAKRDQFAEQMTSIDAHWISNEHPLVFAGIASKLLEPPRPDQFLLCLDGEPVAQTGPHGQSINWLSR